jgi:hypothetical protein
MGNSPQVLLWPLIAWRSKKALPHDNHTRRPRDRLPEGTLSGQMIRDAGAQRYPKEDFIPLENVSLTDGRKCVCTCCERTVAVRGEPRWRVHLRRGWVE